MSKIKVAQPRRTFFNFAKSCMSAHTDHSRPVFQL